MWVVVGNNRNLWEGLERWFEMATNCVWLNRRHLLVTFKSFLQIGTLIKGFKALEPVLMATALSCS